MGLITRNIQTFEELKHCLNYKALMIHFHNNLYEEILKSQKHKCTCALKKLFNNACEGKSNWSAAGVEEFHLYLCMQEARFGQTVAEMFLLATYAMGKVHIFEYWYLSLGRLTRKKLTE